MTHHRTYYSFIIIALLLFSVVTGCSTVQEQLPVSPSRGQLSIFMNGPDKAYQDIVFTLQAVTIETDDNRLIELTSTPHTIHSYAFIDRQILLTEKNIPEGTYRKIRLIVSKAQTKTKERLAELAVPQDGIEIPVNIIVTKNRNTSVFLHWNPDASIRDSYLFEPLFVVRKKTPDVKSLLIYVTNELSDNVSVINRHTGEIVTHIKVGERPRGIAASVSRERSKMYVANSGSNSISVIDPSLQQVENEIPVRFGKEPEGIAVARVSSGTELILVTHFISDSVSVIDPITFEETERIDVGRGPVAVAAEPPLEDIVFTQKITLQDSNTLRDFREKFMNVYVANQNSNTVSVIRIDVRTKQSDEITTLDVDWNPKSIFVDYPRGKVYVANYGSDKLSVINIVQLIKGNRDETVTSINNVGYNIIGVISDPSFNRLYLLQESPAQIVIFTPFSQAFDTLKTIMPPIMGRIPVGSDPRSFLLDPETRILYVVNRGANTVSVVEKTTQKPGLEIPVGTSPYGLALFRE